MDRNWIEVFQWFHKHPELGFQEKATTETIQRILREENIEIVDSGLDTGLIAVVRGKHPGKKVAFRADIDALPIQEQTKLPYRSAHPEIMHACGHDFHITAALAAASRLNAGRENLSGTVYFIFQPGEEVADGAKKVIRTGALKEVTEYYAFHADPTLPVGTFGIKDGTVMAAVDKFQFQVKGKAAHAAMPHLGNNPIPVMLQMISAIQLIIPDRISAIHPSVLTITQISAGNTWNVIPMEGSFQGTLRATEAMDREFIRKKILKTVQSIAELNDMEVDWQWHSGPGPVVNDRDLLESIKDLYQISGVKAKKIEAAMTSDDFSCYLEDRADARGIYLRAGTGLGYPLHHPEFQVNPEAIECSVELLTNILKNTLNAE